MFSLKDNIWMRFSYIILELIDTRTLSQVSSKSDYRLLEFLFYSHTNSEQEVPSSLTHSSWAMWPHKFDNVASAPFFPLSALQFLSDWSTSFSALSGKI